MSTQPHLLADGVSKDAARDARVGLCEKCGEPARVAILMGYDDGKPVRRHLCLECADGAEEQRYDGGSAGHRSPPTVTSLLITAGLILAICSASADQFCIESSVGFGLKQQAGLLIGVCVVVVGTLIRVDLLIVIGSILFGVAALADVLGGVGAGGFGWYQSVALFSGLLLFVLGVLLWGVRLVRERRKGEQHSVVTERVCERAGDGHAGVM